MRDTRGQGFDRQLTIGLPPLPAEYCLMNTFCHRLLTLITALFLAPGGMAADAELAHSLLADLVAINTAPSGGNGLRDAVNMLADLFRKAGFADTDVAIVESAATLPNLVVRLPSAEPRRRPFLMMAHLDVVEADPDDWTVDPFSLTESDGYYYGRGTTDNKTGAAILVANLVRLKREGFVADRDLIVMLTADEESAGNGASLLANEHRALIDAAFALNTDGGLVMMRDDRPRAFIMQTSEKMFVSYMLEAFDPGGHSSLPRADSAISRIARTLTALQDYRFPIDLNETTLAFFTRWAGLAPDAEQQLIEHLLAGVPDADISAALDQAPYYNALARTTCVATRIAGGHADNALPQSASAVVNCRVLPQSSAAETEAAIRELAEPNGVGVRQMAPHKPSPASPLDVDVVEPVTEVARQLWPGIVVIPEMSTGATDGLFLRNVGIPVYGVSAIAVDPDDIRAHGQDERIRIEAFDDATEYWYRLTTALSKAKPDNR